jgi:ABC-2 type transport system ATP-binding protein
MSEAYLLQSLSMTVIVSDSLSAHTPGADSVALTGLAKAFGSVQAVRGIDLSVRRGQTVALLGPNGAGKTTTIDMLLGLTAPDSGSVSVFGRSPAEAIRAGSVGAMLQTGSLIGYLSVRELVAMVAALYPRPLDVAETLRLAGAAGFADRRTRQLSGGETQRVRFAIALVGDPELLVLDEPTAALDVEGRRAFWSAMRGFAARGRTVLFATHYLEEADAYADRIILMAHGQVAADGPPTEIKARVGGKVIRATLRDAAAPALAAIAGVTRAERHGETIALTCSDSDVALRQLLRDYPGCRDIDVRGLGLDDAFLQLTQDHDRSLLTEATA